MCSTVPAGLDSDRSDATTYTEQLQQSPLKYLWDHSPPLGVVHSEITGDFETYMLTQFCEWYVTVVMQGADEATLQSFLSPSAPPDLKLHILTKVLASFIDRRLFITSPRPVYYTPEPCSLLVLAVTGRCPSENRVLAVCDVVSRPVLQGADDTLRHATQEPEQYEGITQVVVRSVLDNQPTWCDCVDYPLPDLDAHYELDTATKARFKLTIDQCLLDQYAPFFSLLTPHTHHSAHQAYAFSTYMPLFNFVNEWISTLFEGYTPYARAFLLGRMMSMPATSSTQPDYEQLCAIVTTGIRELGAGSAAWDNSRCLLTID